MPRVQKFALLLIISLAFTLAAAQPAHAQGAKDKPVMQNVFFNVFWGSATGALMGVATASMSSKEKNNPENLRETMVQGASIGGLAGLAAGIFLVFKDITFDPNRSRILGGGLQIGDARPFRPDLIPPLVFVTDRDNPMRIIGAKAKILDLSF